MSPCHQHRFTLTHCERRIAMAHNPCKDNTAQVSIMFLPKNKRVRDQVVAYIRTLVRSPWDTLGARSGPTELGEQLIQFVLGTLPAEKLLVDTPLAPPKYRFCLWHETEPNQLFKYVFVARTAAFFTSGYEFNCTVRGGGGNATVNVSFTFALDKLAMNTEWFAFCNFWALNPEDPKPTTVCNNISYRGDFRLYLTRKERKAIAKRRRDLSAR